MGTHTQTFQMGPTFWHSLSLLVKCGADCSCRCASCSPLSRAATQAATAAPGSIQALDAALGRLRCLAALAEWERLGELCRDTWRRVEPHVRREMAPIAAHAAWHMGQWDEMNTYVETMDTSLDAASSTGAFLKAVLCVRRGANTEAKVCRALSLPINPRVQQPHQLPLTALNCQ